MKNLCSLVKIPGKQVFTDNKNLANLKNMQFKSFTQEKEKNSLHLTMKWGEVSNLIQPCHVACWTDLTLLGPKNCLADCIPFRHNDSMSTKFNKRCSLIGFV